MTRLWRELTSGFQISVRRCLTCLEWRGRVVPSSLSPQWV